MSGPKEQRFKELLREWLMGFHGQVRPIAEDELTRRLEAYVEQEHQYREKVRFVLVEVATRGSAPKLVLDLGSSAGGLSAALAQAGLEVQGIEPSPAGVEASKLRVERLGLHGIEFQVGVGERLPYPANHFDLVVSMAVLEHVQDVCKVVQEAFRVLKPGGWVYFEVPNNLFPFEGHYKMVWLPMMPKLLAKSYVSARGAYPKFLDHLHYMNRWIVMRHFCRAGFVQMVDVYADYLSGKAAGEPWAERSGRLAQMPWSAVLLRWLCGPLPSAWFVNRAVCLIARKPE